jgi:alpha/beta superfamily hydrolase
MHDAVVSELFACALRHPKIQSVLRYNQRGVGRSSGSKLLNLTGQQDALDLPHILNFLDSQLDWQKDKKVIVIGYSWGACLASYALNQLHNSSSNAGSSSLSSVSSIHAWIGVSFPLGNMSNFILKSQQLLDTVLSSSNKIPRLLVMGDVDQFVSSEEAVVGLVEKSGGRRLLEDDSFTTINKSARTEIVNSNSGELSIRVFRGNDHFWLQDCNRMVCYVLDWGVLRCEGK